MGVKKKLPSTQSPPPPMHDETPLAHRGAPNSTATAQIQYTKSSAVQAALAFYVIVCTAMIPSPSAGDSSLMLTCEHSDLPLALHRVSSSLCHVHLPTLRSTSAWLFFLDLLHCTETYSMHLESVVKVELRCKTLSATFSCFSSSHLHNLFLFLVWVITHHHHPFPHRYRHADRHTIWCGRLREISGHRPFYPFTLQPPVHCTTRELYRKLAGLLDRLFWLLHRLPKEYWVSFFFFFWVKKKSVSWQMTESLKCEQNIWEMQNAKLACSLNFCVESQYSF